MVIEVKREILGFREIKRLVQLFELQLREERIPFNKLVLFGSYASGRAHQDSDIDVAVIVPSSISKTDQKKLSLILWLAKQVHVKLEPHILSTNDFKNRWLSFPAQIRQYGKRMI